jgi:RNA-directed DNA polymerase
MAAQRREMGLAWKPRKTRITPPLKGADGVAGFNGLGCPLRPDPTQSKRGDNTSIQPSRRARAQHQRPIAERGRRHRLEGQARVRAVLNPMIRGWSHDCSTVCSQETFAPMDDAWRQPWRAWSRVRHPHKHRKWGQQRYGRREDGRRHGTPRGRGRRCASHVERPIRRPVKVQARRSPSDGAAGYWRTRRGHDPGVSTRVATWLKRQAGQCRHGGGAIKADDVLDVDHLIPRAVGGREAYANWQVFHRYSHVAKTARERRRSA